MCDIEFSDPLFQTSGISIFFENWYSSWKHIQVGCYEVSLNYAALSEIYDWLKVVPFFGPPNI